MAGPIRISVLANASQANRTFASVGTTVNGVSARVGRAGKVMGLAVAAGAAVAGVAALKFGKDSVKAASDAQQSLGATETVFGRYADTVIARSNKAARAIGLSANEYRELSNVVGASLTGAGVPLKKTTALTDQLNRRASDMAATFGGTTREAVESISSLMRGEADPIERYGVSIKQVDVNARLAAKGQDKLTGAALKSAEMQARLDLLMQKTARTQGAFAREGNTLAHQQQVLGAQWENLKARVGSALLPVLTRLLTLVNDNLGPAFNAVVGYLAPLVARFKDLTGGANGSNAAVAAITAFFTGRLIPAVQAVIGAYQRFYATFIPIIEQVAAAIAAKWSTIAPQVQAIWDSVKNIITSALSIVQSVVTAATAVVLAVWGKFGATMTKFTATALGNLVTTLRGAFKIIEGVFKVVSSALRGDWKGVWDGIKKILSGALTVIKGSLAQAWNLIRTAASVAWSALKVIIAKAWEGAKAAVRNGIRGSVQLVTALPAKIVGAIPKPRTILSEVGGFIIEGLRNGISAAGHLVTDAVEAIVNKIPKKIRQMMGIASPSKVMRALARWIPAGIARGILDGLDGIKAAIDAVGRFITKTLDRQLAAREKAIKKRLDGKAETKALKRIRIEWDRHSKTVVRSVRDENAALAANGRAQDRLTARLEKATTALDAARQAYFDYAAAVKDAVVDTGGLFALAEAEGSDGSLASIIAGRTEALAKAEQWAKVINSLRGRLNDTDLRELIDKGVAGLATAEAIASGGPDAIIALNALQDRLSAVGKSVGLSAADQFYGAGVEAARATAAGLESQADKLDKAAKKLAKALMKAVRKALAEELNGKTGGKKTQGLQIDVDQTHARRQGAALATSLRRGFGVPALDAWATSGGAQAREQRFSIQFTADQVDQLIRGGRVDADITAYHRAGGRTLT
ncbi:phage tail protein [Nocardioides soli]|uniref:Phage tail tape measure protein n=1 Tax=Nocardioides soli TaxID=1036020 RepID=A0A7W4VTD5_9ACTN|nr:hypothetical protein [Nocardioides soli]MBB3041158.1 hypothetical protein [Nocardioides soli]